MTRLFLCTKDVEMIMGKKRTSAQKLIALIKKKYNKGRKDQIHVEEYAEYTGLSVELILSKLK